jgi:hypothetical protein
MVARSHVPQYRVAVGSVGVTPRAGRVVSRRTDGATFFLEAPRHQEALWDIASTYTDPMEHSEPVAALIRSVAGEGERQATLALPCFSAEVS